MSDAKSYSIKIGKEDVVDKRLLGETPLRQLQLTQLFLLDVIDAICRQEGIKYFLSYGTLIGAMRHNGFIPWDDDLDVSMPVDEYRKFLKAAPKYLPESLMLQTPKSVPGCFEAFAKIRDLSSLVIEPHSSMTRPCGVYVDIFPMERFAVLPQGIWHLWARGISVCWRRSRLHRTGNHRFWIGCIWSGICALGWSSLRFVMRAVLRLLSTFAFRKEWILMPEAGGQDVEVGFPDREIFPFGVHEFEGKQYPVPRDADTYLTKYYGNWREPPPAASRSGHHSSVYLSVQAMPFWWTRPHASLRDVNIVNISAHIVKL